jgi:hypothetical protein
MRTFIEALETIRCLCSAPSKIPGMGRVTLTGHAPKGFLDEAKPSSEEVLKWLGSTPTTADLVEAYEVIRGLIPSTFKKIVWASHAIERAVFVRELTELDAARGRGDKTPVAKLRDGALKSEVIARRIGLLRAIEKMGGEADSDATTAELIAALGKAAERARSRKQAAENREAFSRFKNAQASRAPGVPRNFRDFPEWERREQAKKRRAKQGPPPAPQAVVTTVEATGDGETKVVQTKVRAAAQVTKRRRACDAPTPPPALN